MLTDGQADFSIVAMVEDMGVIFRCLHPRRGEVFEKSLDDLAGVDEVFCPGCGTLAAIGRETQLLASARAAAGLARATGQDRRSSL